LVCSEAGSDAGGSLKRRYRLINSLVYASGGKSGANRIQPAHEVQFDRKAMVISGQLILEGLDKGWPILAPAHQQDF